MAAPAVPDDGDEELNAPPPPPTVRGPFGERSTILELSSYEVQTEALLAAYIAVEGW